MRRKASSSGWVSPTPIQSSCHWSCPTGVPRPGRESWLARKHVRPEEPSGRRPSARTSKRLPATPQPFVEPQLTSAESRARTDDRTVDSEELTRRARDLNVRPTVDRQRLLTVVNRIKPAAVPMASLPEEVPRNRPDAAPGFPAVPRREVLARLVPVSVDLLACADRFGYMSPRFATRRSCRSTPRPRRCWISSGTSWAIPARDQPRLGHTRGLHLRRPVRRSRHHASTSPRRSTPPPTPRRSTTCERRRSTSTRCTGVARRSTRSSTSSRRGPPTAIKFQLGTNRNGTRRARRVNGTPAGMPVQTDFDVPRITTRSIRRSLAHRDHRRSRATTRT